VQRQINDNLRYFGIYSKTSRDGGEEKRSGHFKLHFQTGGFLLLVFFGAVLQEQAERYE